MPTKRLIASNLTVGDNNAHYRQPSLSIFILIEKMTMKSKLLFALLFISSGVLAQSSSLSFKRTLAWQPKPAKMTAPGGEQLSVWHFDGCSHSDVAPTLPIFNERFQLPTNAILSTTLEDAVWESITLEGRDLAAIQSEPVIETYMDQERALFFGRVNILPFRTLAPGKYERLRSFTLTIQYYQTPSQPVSVNERTVFNSLLSDGDIYKFGVNQTAVYKLTYDYLKNKLGITNLDNIDPKNIQLLGNGGFMLSERNSDPRPEDLLENSIFISGESDGKFDPTDYILFYATGPSPIQIAGGDINPNLSIKNHLYDRYAYYFLKIGSEKGKRIAEQPSVQASTISNEFDDVIRLEDERYNLLNWSSVHQGSGKRWYGDLFEQVRKREYKMTFPNVIPQPSTVRMEFAGRCDNTNSTVRLTIDGSNFSSNIFGTDNDNNNANIATNVSLGGTFIPDNDEVNITVDYLPTPKISQGWLDYIEVDVRRRLIMTDQMISFRDLNARLNSTTQFNLQVTTANGLSIWDISQYYLPISQSYEVKDGYVAFGATTDNQIKTFIAFYNNASFPLPEETKGKIANQNLHGLEGVELLIIYSPEFEGSVQQLAQHRRIFSGLNVETILVDQVFNEFSSGSKDPVAFRDFSKLLFEKSPDKFKYLLLFGDGSYDPKNNRKDSEHKDFVLVWETDNSLSPIEAHPSDDFFGLLSPNEGNIQGVIRGALEVAVGRIPCNSAAEAQIVVDKIIAYDKNPETLGDWHNRLVYVADDQESNHIDQAEVLSAKSLQTEDWFNAEKVYFDAYPRVASSSEKRIPDAKAAINAAMFKGALAVNYIGHGGPKGWAQERVVDIADIQGWENKDKQTLFITATCSFGGFDDHSFVTGGELCLLQPNGGGMGLFTTVRPVYIGANDALTNAAQQFLFKHENYGYRTIGEILRDGKNTLSSGNQDNARRFLLFGDPAQKLALPEYRVQTDSINGRPILLGSPDTLKALQRAAISGSVTDTLGNVLTSFNGRVFVTIFDKAQELRTLGLNGSQVRTFAVQRNILFRGSATVTNGRFRVNFTMPKDINYAFGYGKISYYAENGTPLDAAGGDNNLLVIGGTSTEVKDEQPPVVQVFLNTDAFVSGGITDDDPKILVKCSDDNGMNVSGVSLGHDLVAVLDDNVTASIVLNEFYESKQDNPREGKALYPLRNLTPGKHSIRVKGWDIANNSGEGYTEFIVAEDGTSALQHVLNYPNPFTTSTNFQFEHNLAGQLMDVQISIFSVSGKLVKTINQSLLPDGYRVTDIFWDGKDDFGDQLARGVYIYRIKVRGTDLSGQQVSTESNFEKLVILK